MPIFLFHFFFVIIDTFEINNKTEIGIVQSQRFTEENEANENLYVYVEFMPRIVGGTEAYPGQFVGQVSF